MYQKISIYFMTAVSERRHFCVKPWCEHGSRNSGTPVHMRGVSHSSLQLGQRIEQRLVSPAIARACLVKVVVSLSSYFRPQPTTCEPHSITLLTRGIHSCRRRLTGVLLWWRTVKQSCSVSIDRSQSACPRHFLKVMVCHVHAQVRGRNNHQ